MSVYLESANLLPVQSVRFVYWQEDGWWLGHLEAYPDYMTQGETLDELRANLKDLYQELTSGAIPNVRQLGDLQIA